MLYQSQQFLEHLRQTTPSYFSALPDGERRRRGIDVYKRDQLLAVMASALSNFLAAHGRLPDLVALPQVADYFFKMKFFDFINTTPNPASKLDCWNYVPECLRERIRKPIRPWISDNPTLPMSRDVKAGTYWLKLDLGCSRHIRVVWPLEPEVTQQIEASMYSLFGSRFGVNHGEWWYGIGRQRLFLEEDLSDLISNGVEVKIYVRRGVVVGGYLVRYIRGASGGKTSQVSFFNRSGLSIPGTLRLGRNNVPHEQVDLRPPPNFASLLEGASAIGSQFDLVRVDLLVGYDGTTLMGELSLCHGNATIIFEPAEFDAYMVNSLFSPLR